MLISRTSASGKYNLPRSKMNFPLPLSNLTSLMQAQKIAVGTRSLDSCHSKLVFTGGNKFQLGMISSRAFNMIHVEALSNPTFFLPSKNT